MTIHDFMKDKRLLSIDGIDIIPELNEAGMIDFYGSEFCHTWNKEEAVKLIAVLTEAFKLEKNDE